MPTLNDITKDTFTQAKAMLQLQAAVHTAHDTIAHIPADPNARKQKLKTCRDAIERHTYFGFKNLSQKANEQTKALLELLKTKGEQPALTDAEIKEIKDAMKAIDQECRDYAEEQAKKGSSGLLLFLAGSTIGIVAWKGKATADFVSAMSSGMGGGMQGPLLTIGIFAIAFFAAFKGLEAAVEKAGIGKEHNEKVAEISATPKLV